MYLGDYNFRILRISKNHDHLENLFGNEMLSDFFKTEKLLAVLSFYLLGARAKKCPQIASKICIGI